MRLPSAIAALLLTGCFYSAEIDQRPSADIRQDLPVGGMIHRGDMVILSALGTDPDGDELSYAWHVSACTDPSDQNTDCDAPFRSDVNPSTETQLTFDVPFMRADGVTPVKGIRVLLDTTDALGATAKPTQEDIINLEDLAPTIALHQASSHNFVVDTHVQLFAQVTDADDPIDMVTVDWSVETPAPNAQFDIADLPSQSDPAHPDTVTYGKSLVPHAPGQWMVHVTATDPFGQATTNTFLVQVGDDLPPCIAAASPIASPTQELPMFEPTLFQVPVVVDDLDLYPPPQGNDPDLGTATFSWSMKAPGASAFSPLPITSNGVLLDPSTFSPNDLVELRVEIHDRINRDFSQCLPDDPTCALDASDLGCFQRETWTVRVQ